MLRIFRTHRNPYFSAIRKRLFCSNVAAGDAKDATVLFSAVAIVATEQSPADSPHPATKRSSNLLKFGIFGTLTAATAAAGYATYVPAQAIELYLDLRGPIKNQGFTEPSADKLLPDLHPLEQGVFMLVLDLNETLVYSDWKRERGWRTFKRPGVDAFLEHLAQFYEIVVCSDQQSMYVDPVIERLDKKGCIRYRLSRSAMLYHDGKHYRDFSKLNRDPSRILYVSGRALESSLRPDNCVPIKAWMLDADDTSLLDLIPFLEYVARNRPSDIRQVLASYKGSEMADARPEVAQSFLVTLTLKQRER